MINRPSSSHDAADRSALTSRLFGSMSQVGAGIYDGMSAILAESAVFDFLWLGSFSISASLGLPDAGLLDVADVKRVLTTARRVSSLPLVVDVEAGYGDDVRAFYAAEALMAAGATAVCLEDNGGPHRCSLYDGFPRTLNAVGDQCAKIAAMREAVAPYGGIIIARTEAIVAGLGVEEALRRSEAYVSAGARAVFVQCVSPQGLDQLLSFSVHWNRRTPLFIAPTRYEQVERRAFHDAGATHYIYANQALRAAHHAIAEVYRQVMTSGTVANLETRLSGVSDVAADVDEGRIRRTQPVPATQP
jgi:phosphoenolpyruvate phosphomutase